MIEPGFYWVRIVGHGDEWTVAELDAGKWWVIGSGDSWTFDQLEVGQKIERN